MRFVGCMACALVAVDCFRKNGGELQLPYWFWVIVGLAWLLHAFRFVFKETIA